MLRLPRGTLEELAREFPDDIGRTLRDMALSGRRNMARMRWNMVWGKHRLQVTGRVCCVFLQWRMWGE